MYLRRIAPSALPLGVLTLAAALASPVSAAPAEDDEQPEGVESQWPKGKSEEDSDAKDRSDDEAKEDTKEKKAAAKEEKQREREEKRKQKQAEKNKQDAGDGGASVSAAGTATAGSGAKGDVEGSTSRRYSPRGGKQKDKDKWIHRWRPVNHMGEVGVYGGVWFPSKHIELFESGDSLAQQGFQQYKLLAPDIGVRGGYYPFWFFGIEAEGGVMPAKIDATDASALVWTVRGHLVGQLGLWSITPFLLVGSGVLGVAADDQPASVGNEQDVTIHFGGGVKFYINRWIQLRLDVRDVVSNRRGVGEGLTSSPEILLGLSVTLGRKKKRKARPRSGDRDGDGVRDVEDFCPDVFGVAPRGCPQVCLQDRDGDGLADPEDECPDEPETRNGYQDGDGCPDEVPPELDEIAGIMEAIHFDTDKDTIKAKSRPTLDRASELMKKYGDLHVEISGHTDTKGGYRHNMDLSRRRAESVKRYMVDKGIDESRLSTRGAGPDEPIDTNETDAGRARNRRIEFRILDDKEIRSTRGARSQCPE